MSTGRPIGGVRRAQLITTYGVGSIVAVNSESFMIAGIDRWPDPEDRGEQLVHEPRLQRQLGVRGFRLPPASDNERRGDVPVVRFPLYQSCPGCNRLAKAGAFGVRRSPAKCKRCDRELVPSRFVICCANGHIDDFPYFNWVHKGSAPTGASEDPHDMKIEASGRSAALRDIIISCSCGKRVSMEGALSKAALKGITSCPGTRPWLGSASSETCGQMPRAMQRGASGVWFSDVRSAISIPPWSEGVQKLIAKHWKSLGKVKALRELVEDMELAEGTPYTVDEIVQAVERRRRIEQGLDDDSEVDLKAEEYEALTKTTVEKSRRQDFVCVPAPEGEVDPSLAIDQVMRVKRLREVRVLQSFTRLAAPSPADDKKRRAPLFSGDDRPDWLPAIEVIGEGVFLRLDTQRLEQWESRSSVIGRTALVDASYRRRFEQQGARPDRGITPRLMLVHTLSHAIINEWSLDCGYPAAALRERLYVSEKMAGILIYTATSDSAGSLGGIVAQVESGDLGGSIRRALDRISWCSSDPLCIESPAGGVDNLNHAACHACVLLPETSCEEFNTLLDRALLVGTPDDQDLGFFGPVLSATTPHGAR
ncbi:protein of unknown function [Thermomonospora echinospora]|uniref:MrfA-like Zn-binding domain-containing protein n=1 Tax=Thermomonospora echinospora TaxID=1992 RepID=A0A1H6E8R0_9ACTN|nr:DUF1998 domain-containing protein [Thermomonospora echinospora]SEG94130.1 protein of unknown function [Thermomonospora echinospora]